MYDRSQKNKMQNSKYLKGPLMMLAVLSAVLVLSSVSRPQPPISAENSRTSDTHAIDPARTVGACAAAAIELAATRKLVDALEMENRSLRQRLATSAGVEQVLVDLTETRKEEASMLRKAIEAKDQTIAAKDTAIAKQDVLISELRSRKLSLWKRVGYILAGAAAVSILK